MAGKRKSQQCKGVCSCNAPCRQRHGGKDQQYYKNHHQFLGVQDRETQSHWNHRLELLVLHWNAPQEHYGIFLILEFPDRNRATVEQNIKFLAWLWNDRTFKHLRRFSTVQPFQLSCRGKFLAAGNSKPGTVETGLKCLEFLLVTVALWQAP